MQPFYAILIVGILCLIEGGVSQTLPLYTDSTNFYSASATFDLSLGIYYIITVPIQISTLSHQEPFYGSVLNSVNKIYTNSNFYHFIDLYMINSTAFEVGVDSFTYTVNSTTN